MIFLAQLLRETERTRNNLTVVAVFQRVAIAAAATADQLLSVSRFSLEILTLLFSCLLT